MTKDSGVTKQQGPSQGPSPNALTWKMDKVPGQVVKLCGGEGQMEEEAPITHPLTYSEADFLLFIFLPPSALNSWAFNPGTLRNTSVEASVLPASCLELWALGVMCRCEL